MLESLVSTLLNRFLGAYVSNLNYNQLQIGIWSGEVVLRNLKLKREALDKLNLPVDVLEGYLGELTLNIPWSNLKGKPVMVDIKDVYVLAVPRNESTMTTEELQQRQYEAKMRKLANAELVDRGRAVEPTDNTKDAQNETFVNQLVTKILNNLQFSITNIHIRYEDDVSAPGHRFAAGITLSELSAISTDENWIPQTIGDAVNTIHKLATLESLSVYWNTDTRSLSQLSPEEAHKTFMELIATKSNIPSEHQYILKPVSGTGRVKMNKKFGSDVPKGDVTMLFDELAFVIDDEQYRDAILMIDLFHSYLKKQKYQHLHPPRAVKPKQDPRAYFQFAARAVLSEIQERNHRWTWDHFKERRDNRRSYLECYVAEKLGRATPDQQDRLNELEHKLSFEDIRFYRSLAKSRLKREKAILAAEEERKKKEAAANASNKGWLSSWWYGSGATTPGEQDSDEDSLVVTEEQKQEFYDAIEYDEDKVALAESIDLAKDTIMLALRMTLNKGSFTVKRKPHSENPVELVSLVFDTVMLGAIRYVESFKATAALGDLRLYDGVTQSSQYRQLIGVKQKEENSDKRSSVDQQIFKFSNMNNPFFSVVFEHMPLDGRADNAVALTMRNIDIVYNPVIIREILEFFRPPETSADSVNALIEVAGDTFEDIKNQTRSTLEFALERHTTLDLRVDMDAPVIVIPEDCTSSSSRGIVLDAGHINVESNLADPQAVEQMKAKKNTEYTSEDYVHLRSMMYDKFTVHLTQTKILVGDSVKTCLEQVRSPKPEYNYLHLVERIDMTFLVEMCILRKSNDLARFRVSGHLPLLAVNFSDTKYRSIMQLPKLIDDSGLFADAQESVDNEEKDALNVPGSDRRMSFMNTRLWEQAERELFLDTDSEQTESNVDDDETTTQSLTETADTEISSQPATTSSRSTKANKQRSSDLQRIFELSFKVDQVTATVREARRRWDRSEDGPLEIALCDLSLQHLSLDYCLRPHDMTVNLALKSLDVVDRMEHGNEFKYLVTSDVEVLHSEDQDVDDVQQKDLVNVEYIRVDSDHHAYIEKYKGIDQTAKVTLSTLNFIVTRSSVLTLYNFVLNTFVDQETPSSSAMAPKRASGANLLSADNKDKPPQDRRRSSAAYLPAVLQPQPQSSSSIHVRLLLDSVNFVLNNDGIRLATGELSHGDLTTLMANGKMKLAAKFANFSLTDDLGHGQGSKDAQTRYTNQLLTIQGEELIDFSYESFLKDDHDYPGYDQSLFLRMGSAQLTFLERPVIQLLEFLSKFAAMKEFYDRAREAALQSAQQLQQSVSKLHFDIIIKTPVVLFPEMHEHPSDVVVAHLGEIWASNSFVDEDGDCISMIQAGIRAISLTSKFYVTSKDSDRARLQTLPIVDDIDLIFDIKRPQDDAVMKRPELDVKGKIKDVSMRLTERQYVFLMDAINMVSRIVSPTEVTEAPSPSVRGPTSQSTLESNDQRAATASNETESTNQDGEEAVGNLPPRIHLDFHVQTICLEVYKGNEDQNELQTPASLARIALNDSSLQLDMLKNDTMKLNLQTVSLTLDDTRPNIKSKFKEIMPAMDNGHQFELQMDISKPDPNRHAIALITINDPKVILSLDHTFMLSTFAMKPFTNRALPSSSNQPSDQSTPPPAGNEGSMEISFRLNVINADFVLLANPDASDSEAVVLSAEQVMISQQTVTAIVVKQMGMFLCRMDTRKMSTLRFIQPFDISLSMNNNMGTGDQQTNQSMELEMDVDALVLRLSYRDVMLITDIFNKAYELYNGSIGATTTDAALDSSPASASVLKTGLKELPPVVHAAKQTLSRESLRAAFHGMQVILIEDIHEMPMVDMTLKPFDVDVTNWSRSLAADVSFSAYVNYFNIKNSHWEPLIEPWDFKIEVAKKSTRPQDPLNVKLISNTALNVNVTHTFLESALATVHLWHKRNDLAYSGERGTIAPYKLRNRTGYQLHLWNSGDPNGETVIKELNDGEDMPWWFEDWKKRRETTTTSNNLLNVQLDGALWESLRNIPVDTEGEHIYALRPVIHDVQHRVIFDVKLVDNLKVVTIRSALVIENRTLLPVDVLLVDARGNPERSFKKIAPGEDYPIPIEKAYHNRFSIRPDAGFGYQWTNQTLHWKDFARPKTRTNIVKCTSKENDMAPFLFQVNAILDKKNILFGHYPVMSIRLSAPVEIENLLPYDFNFRVIDRTAGQEFSSFLRKGGVTPIHVIENGHFLLLSVQMPDTKYKASEFAIISTRGSDDFNVEDSLQFEGPNNTRLSLRISAIDVPDSGGARKYSIYCPYVIINKTDSMIAFKAKPAWQSAMFQGSHDTVVCRPSSKAEPFMYSYPKHDNRNRSLIQVAGSEWSQPLSFEAVGSVYDVAMPTPNKAEEVHVGISIQEGHGKNKLSKVITFTPRFILSNHMDVEIRFREPESRVDHSLAPKQRIPLYNLRRIADKQLSVKLPGISNTWSAPFNIQDIGKVHVRLDSADGSTAMLMSVTTILQDATIFILLNKESSDKWPYKLVNQTKEDMTFYQEDPVLLRDDYSEPRARSHRTRRYRLPAGQSVVYSWDMPAVKDKRIILNINGHERSINLQEIGSQPPFQHTTKSGGKAITSIDIRTKGTMQILQLTPFNQQQSYFRPLPSRSSSMASMTTKDTAAREGFEAIDVKLVFNFVFQLQLSQIGCSLINRQLQEIAYITFRGFDIKFTDSNMYQSVRWNIEWVQIDSQIYGTMFPILLYPTNMTKETNHEILPTLQMALDRVKDDSHGVLYFKYFSILLQEMSVEIDEAFIYAIIDFTHVDVPGWNEPAESSELWEYTTEIPDVKPTEDIAQLYFEVLSIQPIRFDLSFLRTDQVNIVDERPQGSSPLMFFINVLTMAIGNINAAPMRFNALAVENLRASGPDLANRVFIHYSDQFVYQVHRMLGSADFLGNPVGLFNNLSSGVAELFYEPWQGLIMSDRPQDLGMGIARGFSGFVRKSVFGVSDSFTKFTGSISKGLSAATMDREYQDKRRMTMARNKPRHALGGVTQGANYFANSLASGVAGLVTRPIEGATKEGVGGFFSGVGKGLMGAVTKPVVGVFDLASNVSEGIRNTTTPSDTNDIEPIRLPRFIDQDGILRPYSAKEAQGQSWLKDVDGGRYAQDAYIAHCYVQSNERVALLSSQRVMLIRTRRLSLEWQEPFTEIQTIKCEATGIAIYLRNMSQEPFLVIADKKAREWFFKKIEEAVIKYNAARCLE
ncbi:uncharacterized protein BYT42DRAFT_612143 [Radiomyces spectabilis]|uniref:uncharacterized protein n=1 Tax=Radiomyces spectabilis TaxID=64574 RepID=UPI00221FFDF4|nr:uncharacterized protein BYT42DRAFT_612143 [Radiomyces spectabilis]KAI8384441.1 hypothetical protein BYT42DRAFT_612143 [Radiomyces spectabilis]